MQPLYEVLSDIHYTAVQFSGIHYISFVIYTIQLFSSVALKIRVTHVFVTLAAVKTYTINSCYTQHTCSTTSQWIMKKKRRGKHTSSPKHNRTALIQHILVSLLLLTTCVLCLAQKILTQSHNVHGSWQAGTPQVLQPQSKTKIKKERKTTTTDNEYNFCRQPGKE